MSKPVSVEKQLDKPAPSAFEAIRSYLWERKLHLERMLPKGSVSSDALLGSAILAAKKTGALLECDPESVFLALMDAAALGLTVHWGPRGEAALVPFKKKCQLIIGYRGLVKLMLRSGEVASVHAEVVNANDRWEYAVTHRGVRLHHEPVEIEPGPPRLYYAAAFLRGGGCEVARLLPEKAERIRDMQLSKLQDWQKKDSPYTLWPTEMAIKAAVRQLAKLVPLDAVEHAFEVEDKHEREVGGEAKRTMTVAPPLPPATGIRETIEPARQAEPVAAKRTIIEDESTTPDKPALDPEEAQKWEAWLSELRQVEEPKSLDAMSLPPEGHPMRDACMRAFQAQRQKITGGKR